MLQAAVMQAMRDVIQANKGQPNSLNIALTDGETVIATRYRNSEHEEPPSLYFHLGPMPGEKARGGRTNHTRATLAPSRIHWSTLFRRHLSHHRGPSRILSATCTGYTIIKQSKTPVSPPTSEPYTKRHVHVYNPEPY